MTTYWFDRLGAWLDKQPDTFAGVSLKEGKVSYRGQYQPVAEVRVLVESAGQLHKRSTLTRTVAGGLLFGSAGAVVGAIFKKTVDDRELYLLVEGERFSWAVPVRPSHGELARKFAARINTAAGR